ncbi:MAG: hypothetical protein LBC74_06660 [Planctomycetaceae bacterium]|jgi:hypothetical protein|nr:hypothetical protein [Planctomycetaceae bacterium]
MSKVISFIDKLVSRVGEQVNPIMVFELRRQFNLVNHGIYFAIMYGILGLLAAVALVLPVDKLNSFLNMISATDMFGLAVIILLFQFCFFITLIPQGLIYLVFFFRWRDPSILTAVNDAVLYWGLYQIGLFYVVKAFCLLYFWVIFLYLLGLISFDLFGIFPVVWLFSITMGNMLYSFSIIFRHGKLFLIYVIQMSITIGTVFTIVYMFFSNYAGLLYVIFFPGKQVLFIETWNWLPVVFFMFPISFYATIKVIHFNLTSNKSIYKKLLKLFLIYSIIIIVTIIALHLSFSF